MDLNFPISHSIKPFVVAAAICFLSSAGYSQVTVHHVPGFGVSPSTSHPVPPPAIAPNKGPASQPATEGTPDQQLSVYSHGDPTNEEQYQLELINRARANPPAEGVLLSTTKDPDVSGAYTYFMTPTRAQVKSDFTTYPPKPPLAFNAKLINAARGHSQDMLAHNYQSHTGSDGSTLVDRVNAAGYVNSGYVGENIFAYGVSMWDIDASFLIDFGNDATLGHRKNILDLNGNGLYTEIGLGIIHGGTGSPDVGPIITTEDFGDVGKTFITGVVYDDLNKNGMYDIGEGLAGVTIKPSSGSFTAVSSASGGYAIPYTGSAQVTVTASGGSLSTAVTHTIQFNAENYKLDFLPDRTGFPGEVLLVLPLSDTSINIDTVRFRWNKLTGATVYRLQVATDSLFKKLVVNDSTLTDTSRGLQGLRDSGSYWWRAGAKNAKGWGSYSAIAHFGVALTPFAVSQILPKNSANLPDSAVHFTWNSAQPRVVAYAFLLSKSPSMTNPVFSDSNLTDTTLSLDVTNFAAGQTYYWNVQAQNDNGWGSASGVRSFSIFAAGVAESVQSGDQPLTVAPNPTNGETHLRFTLQNHSTVSLKIYNALGETVATLLRGTLQPNSYDVVWNRGNLAAGVYFYSLHIGDRVDAGRIVVTK